MVCFSAIYHICSLNHQVVMITLSSFVNYMTVSSTVLFHSNLNLFYLLFKIGNKMSTVITFI